MIITLCLVLVLSLFCTAVRLFFKQVKDRSTSLSLPICDKSSQTKYKNDLQIFSDLWKHETRNQ